MDPDEQRRWLRALVEAAAKEDCLVAPVGSVYLLIQGEPRVHTKDVDGVIHMANLDVAPLDAVKRIASHLGLGEPNVTVDQAVVWVKVPSGDRIELIRGRSASKGGFFPRGLLRAAAAAGTREGGVLVYRPEHTIVLKADAAIDRRDRAGRDPARSAEHVRRAAAFEADVFAEAQRANAAGGLDVAHLASAIGHLKRARREAVAAMLRAAGVDLERTRR